MERVETVLASFEAQFEAFVGHGKQGFPK